MPKTAGLVSRYVMQRTSVRQDFIALAQRSNRLSIKLFANSLSGVLVFEPPKTCEVSPPNINVLWRPLSTQPIPLERSNHSARRLPQVDPSRTAIHPFCDGNSCFNASRIVDVCEPCVIPLSYVQRLLRLASKSQLHASAGEDSRHIRPVPARYRGE